MSRPRMVSERYAQKCMVFKRFSRVENVNSAAAPVMSETEMTKVRASVFSGDNARSLCMRTNISYGLKFAHLRIPVIL